MKHDPELKVKARKLYEDGLSYSQIQEQIHIAKSTVSLWCRDIAEARRSVKTPLRHRQNGHSLPKIKLSGQEPYADYWMAIHRRPNDYSLVKLTHKVTGEVEMLSLMRYNMAVHLGRRLLDTERVVRKNGPSAEAENLEFCTVYSKLPDEAVVSMRKAAALNPRVDFEALCDIHNVKPAVLKEAIKGKSYKHLDQIAPPFKGRFLPRVEGFNRAVRPTLHECVCVMCDKPFKSLVKDSEVCRTKSCQHTLRNYQRYR